MNVKLVGVLLSGCLALPGCSSDAGAVGSYIGGDPNARIMLQIASVKDHDVRGKLIAVTTDTAGKVTAIDRALEGTIDGGAVNLNLETGSGLSLLTGTMTGDRLELTSFVGDKSEKLVFMRSDPSRFAGLVEGVRKSAAQIKFASSQEMSQRAQLRRSASDQQRIDAFVADLASRSDRLSESALKIDAVIDGYHSTVAKAARLADQSASLSAATGGRDYRIDQISFVRQRNNDTAATDHDSITTALNGLDHVVAQHEADAASMLAKCQIDRGLDCSRVVSIMPTYRVRVADFRQAAQREQSTYATEHKKF